MNLKGWIIIEDSDDGSLLVESPIGQRRRVWQGGDKLLVKKNDALTSDVADIVAMLTAEWFANNPDVPVPNFVVMARAKREARESNQ